MKHPALLIVVSAAAFGVASSVAIGSEKPPAAYVEAMHDLDGVSQGLSKAIEAADFDAVAQHAATAVAAFGVVQRYWAGKDDDARRAVDAGIRAAGDLSALATLKSVDGMEDSAKALKAVCAGCHEAHREELPDKSYQIK
jgi:hypothetical protein